VSRCHRAHTSRASALDPEIVIGIESQRTQRCFNSGCATMPAPRPRAVGDAFEDLDSIPRRASASAASSPLIEPPITSARFTLRQT